MFQVRSICRICVALVFSSFALSGCGDDTADVTFAVTYESEALRSSLYSSNVTARVWYRYRGLGDEVRFQPGQTVPTQEPVPGSEPQINRDEFSTASGAGFSVGADSEIDLRNVPLGKEETEVAIEFLKTLGDGGIYVIAYAVYRGPETKLTRAQLAVDARSGLTVRSGRSCGRCISQERINVSSAESAFRERCGSGVNTAVGCLDWGN